jgi:O-antigen ligase
MIQAKSTVQEKNSNNPYLFINLVFSFFPISFILGSLIVNLNLVLFCCLGIYYLKSKILTTKFDFSIKIIFLFFFILFFSTSLSLIKSLYFEEYDSTALNRLVKSILFFRFFLLLITIYLLNKFDILLFKYFLLTAAFSSILLSLDIIYQHYFGFDIIGLKSSAFRNSGFFGDEAIAGGYLLRFSFFAIFFTIFIFKDKNYTKFISTVIVICVVCTGIFFSGNRMPFILFIFGLLLILLFNFKIKKILLMSFLTLFILFNFIISSDQSFKSHLIAQYSSFYGNASNTLIWSFYIKHSDKNAKSSDKSSDARKTFPCYEYEYAPKPYCSTWIRTSRADVDELWEGEVTSKTEKSMGQKTTWYSKTRSSFYRKQFLAAIYTWKLNKIFGNGIKSSYSDCLKLAGPDINIEMDEVIDKKNVTCSNHPHNYYFQILTTTGTVGLFIIFVIGLLFVVFALKNFKFIKKFDMTNIILLSTVISFFLETFPLRSTGSLYTTNNATYIILVGSIIISYKKLLKIK